MIRIPQIGGFFLITYKDIPSGYPLCLHGDCPMVDRAALEKAEVILPMKFDEYINAILLCFCHVLLPPDTQQLSDFGEYIDLLPMSTDDSFKKNRRFSRLAPTILLLRIDDSFRKHRRLFFKSPWMLGEVNQLHFQKESFPAFSGLFFSSSTESADNLTEVILHQQTPATRPSCFFVDKTFISNILNSGNCRAVPGYMLALLEDGHQ